MNANRLLDCFHAEKKNKKKSSIAYKVDLFPLYYISAPPNVPSTVTKTTVVVPKKGSPIAKPPPPTTSGGTTQVGGTQPSCKQQRQSCEASRLLCRWTKINDIPIGCLYLVEWSTGMKLITGPILEILSY